MYFQMGQVYTMKSSQLFFTYFSSMRLVSQIRPLDTLGTP